MSEDSSRTRLLDAAERAFAEGGLAGARVAAIVEDAGVNKAMLYYWFDSKQALYEAVVERVFEQITDVVQGLDELPDLGPAERVMAFAKGYNRVLQSHPRIERILLRALLDSPDDLFDLLQPRLQKVLPAVAGQVARGQATGELNPAVNPLLMPPSMVAPLVFFALARPLLARVTGAPEEALSALWQAHIFELLLNGLRARPQEAP